MQINFKNYQKLGDKEFLPWGKVVPPADENSSGDVCLGIFANEMLGIGGTDMPGIEKL